MSGEQLGRLALQADAIYCAAAAAATAAASARVARILGVPRGAPLAAAGVTLPWALALAGLSRRPGWRGPVAAVAAANGATAALLLAVAARHPGRDARRLLVATGVEVGAFSAVQAVAGYRG